MSRSENPAVTVIMPVYNSEEYLTDAVVSILAEDFDFELLLIDDGSTDGSGLLCDACAEVDSRVRALHKKNGGMCQARNYGIKHARGEYITFCDNDDAVLPGFVSDNFELAHGADVDCVRFGRIMRRIGQDGSLLMQVVNNPQAKEIRYCAEVFEDPTTFFYGTGGVWTGLYKTSFLRDKNIIFDEGLRQGYEDIVFNNQIYMEGQRIAFNPNPYYIWTRRALHSSSMKLADNHLLGLDRALESFAHLVELRDGLEQASGFCSAWMIECAKDCLTVERYAGTSFGKWDAGDYKKIRDILTKYELIINSGKPPAKYRIISQLLFMEQYKALHAYVSAGVEFKKFTRRFFGR